MQVHDKYEGKYLLLFLCGMAIGSGAILPGISGGVLCVAFGLYGLMVEFFAHPFLTLKERYRIFIPVFLGCAVGFLILARAVEFLLRVASVSTTAFFAGLIFGTLPGLFKNVCDQNGDTDWSGFVISLALSYIFFQSLSNAEAKNIQPNFGWYLFSGSVWAFSMLLPGLSSSSILLFLGLYQPMAEGIGNLDVSVLLPLMTGFLLTLLICARAVNLLMEKCGRLVTRILLGFVISSTFAILPASLSNGQEVVSLLLWSAAGFLIAFRMDGLSA